MSFRRNRFRRNVMDPITRNLSSEIEKSGFLAPRSMYTLLDVLLNILQNREIKEESSNTYVSAHGNFVF